MGFGSCKTIHQTEYVQLVNYYMVINQTKLLKLASSVELYGKKLFCNFFFIAILTLIDEFS